MGGGGVHLEHPSLTVSLSPQLPIKKIPAIISIRDISTAKRIIIMLPVNRKHRMKIIRVGVILAHTPSRGQRVACIVWLSTSTVKSRYGSTEPEVGYKNISVTWHAMYYVLSVIKYALASVDFYPWL